MAIVSVSREIAALGDETAHEIAKQLNFRLVDKDTLEERIKSYGIESRKLEKYDERKPSFFASLSQDRDEYLHYLKSAIITEAEHESCVFIGRGTGMMLKNMPAHISIFLAAPPEIRIERVKDYFHCDERQARHIINRSDQDRLGFHRYFFDIDWRDPENHHIALNTGIFSPAACAEIVSQVGSHVFSAEAEAQNTIRLKEMILEQGIKHHIVYEKEIPIHFLEAAVSGGIVTLYGVASSQALIDTALNAAREVAGSAAVKSDIQAVREYSVMP